MLAAELNVPVGPLMIMIAIISFLGFLLENAWLAIRKGFIDNRNMFAPFLVGYGLAVADLCSLIKKLSEGNSSDSFCYVFI